MNPKKAPGEYGEYDKDGSQKKYGLFTNNSAVLIPYGTNGEKGDPEEFNKPTVSYTVEEEKPVIPPTPPVDPEDLDVPVDPETPEVPDVPVTPEEPADPSEPAVPEEQEEADAEESPKTGDESNIVLWMALGVIALGGLAVIEVMRRKENM